MILRQLRFSSCCLCLESGVLCFILFNEPGETEAWSICRFLPILYDEGSVRALLCIYNERLFASLDGGFIKGQAVGGPSWRLEAG